MTHPSREDPRPRILFPCFLGSLFGPFHQCFVEISHFLTFSRITQRVTAVTVQIPGQPIIFQDQFQVLDELCLERWFFDGRDQFHPLLQITIAPVGTAEEKLWLAVVVEIEDAVMFQEAAQNTDNLVHLGINAYATDNRRQQSGNR